MKIGLAAPHALGAGVPWMRTLHTSLLSLLCFVSCSVWAATLEDVRTAFDDARTSKKDPDTVVSVIDIYLEQNRDSPVALAYKGSIRTMQGATARVPLKKMAYMDEGFRLLDKAVSMSSLPPQSAADSVACEVLLISGITNASVPKFFKRRPIAKSNFEALLSRKGFQQFNRHSQSLAYAWLAVLAYETGDAKSTDYLVRARQLNLQAADEIWSKR